MPVSYTHLDVYKRQLGDIGCHFPDSDPAYAGADSLALLDQVMQLLHAEGWQVENVDATILAQRPKLAPYLGVMADHLAAHMGVELGQVNVCLLYTSRCV